MFVTLQELTDRVGHSFPGALQTQATIALEDATELVKEVAEGELDGETDATVSRTIKIVVVNMVRRALFNPNQLTSEALDGHQWAVSDHGRSGVFASRQEQRRIRRSVGLLSVKSHTLSSWLPERQPGIAFENDFEF